MADSESLFGIATTGRLTRWLPARPSRAPTAAAVARFGAVSADGLGLVLLAAELAVGPGRLFGPGRRGGSGQPRPDGARQARRTPVPGQAREPDLTRLRAWGGPRLEP